MIEIETATLEGMIGAGDQQITDLERKVADIKAQIDECHLELEQLANDYQTRSERLKNASTASAQSEMKHEQAIGYAVLARNKPTSQDAIKAVDVAKKAFDAARSEAKQLTDEHEEANLAASQREASIKKQIALLQSELETHFDQLQQLASGRDQALKELGPQKYASLDQEYEQLRSSVRQFERDLVLAQAELNSQYYKALASLANWPDLQRQMRRKQPVEDDNLLAMEATLYYANTLLKHISGVADLPESLRTRGITVFEALIVPGDVVMMAKRYPQNLQATRDKIKRIADAYRDHLASMQ